MESKPVAENVAVRPPLDITAEPEFQLWTIKWRLLKFLLSIREWLNFKHDECMAGDVSCGDAGKIPIKHVDRAELKHALQSHGARHGRVIVVPLIRQQGVGGSAIH